MSDLLLYKSTRRLRRAVTLVELLVVLAIMTVMAAVVGLAAPPIHRTDTDVATTRVTAARRTALSSGQPVSITVVSKEHPYAVTAYPNGAVVADSALAVDRLAGVLHQRVVTASAPHAP
jgi:prepilin-type N-terminal cleavage/methylation domain-containing protein